MTSQEINSTYFYETTKHNLGMIFIIIKIISTVTKVNKKMHCMHNYKHVLNNQQYYLKIKTCKVLLYTDEMCLSN